MRIKNHIISVLFVVGSAGISFLLANNVYAACTAKGSDWNNCPGEGAFTSQASQAAAARNGLVIDPTTGGYSSASVRAFQQANNLGQDGKVGTVTGPIVTAQTLGANPSTLPSTSDPLNPVGTASSNMPTLDAPSESGPTKVIVSEEIPGANCTCYYDNGIKDENGNTMPSGCDNNPAGRKYVCEVGTGLSGFQSMFASLIKWVVYITMLLGVVAIVGAGILWAWGSDSEEYTKKAKGWVMNIIIGLVILFTFRYILGFLAPWIFK